MVEYKKVQNIYQKKRKRLADKIASGELLDVPDVYLDMSAVLEVQGEVFRSDEHPY
mgnify:FL=1